MGFLKSLFGKKQGTEDEPFIPIPTQDIPGLEPIIVQAVENLFPRAEDQREIFDLLAKNRKNTTVLIILSLLTIAPTDLKGCKTHLSNNTSTPIDPAQLSKDGTFYHLAMDSGFHSIKHAEKWVKSITISQA